MGPMAKQKQKHLRVPERNLASDIRAHTAGESTPMHNANYWTRIMKGEYSPATILGHVPEAREELAEAAHLVAWVATGDEALQQ